MKLVLVEDNNVLQKSIEKVLIQEGHSVRCFNEGTEAFAFLSVEKDAVDIAIIDYMLPGMDGVLIIKRMREKGIMTPVLMLTARGDVRDKVYGLGSGADYYLTKPFEFEELLACLAALYRRPKEYQATTYAIVAGTTFNADTHVLRGEGASTLLTPAESGILEHLLRNRGKTLSQQDIYEHVFDFAKENWSNTIEVHIKNLRKKLLTTTHENIIKTVRGMGYRMEA